MCRAGGGPLAAGSRGRRLKKPLRAWEVSVIRGRQVPRTGSVCVPGSP